MMKIKNVEDYQKLLKQSNEIMVPWENLKNKSILITGAYGLIGSYIVDCLMFRNNNYNSNIQIYALGRTLEKMNQRFEEYLNDNNFHYLIQDVSFPILENINIDFIIHAASGANPNEFSVHPVDVMKANFLGMYNILEFARTNKCKRVYFVSSGEVYGNNAQNGINEEDDSSHKLGLVRNCYPDSKRAAETLCMSYIKQYNLDAVIGRFSHVYGPTYTDTDNRVIFQFINNALSKKNIVLKSKGFQKRSYCFIADAVNAIFFQLLCGINGEVYNVSNDNCFIQISDLANMIADCANVKVEYNLPSDTEKKGYTTILETNMSSKKLKDIGWAPLYDLDDGIRTTIRTRCKCENK